MSTLNLDAIKARHADALQADGDSPWTVEYDGSYYVQATAERNRVADNFCEETAEFLAHAITDVPALVTEIEHLQALESWLKERVAEDADSALSQGAWRAVGYHLESSDSGSGS